MPHWLPSLIQMAQKSLMFLLSLPRWFGLFSCHYRKRAVVWVLPCPLCFLTPWPSPTVHFSTPLTGDILPILLELSTCHSITNILWFSFYWDTFSGSYFFLIKVDVDSTGIFSPLVFSQQRSQTVRYFLYHSYLMDRTAYLLTVTVISGFR